ncbi:MAG: D-alanine--D-alanine ligase [Anaeromicrobium sp.]|jgi:D-alanine-D-alanine ligase|uniref:D-alanine--D-alanine ligase family protein n=1 Tax=Anaeromicrobium sp. TaxID=1929132 RepID=UPI0025D8B90D|nr:D-alanine--D-alanine ligase family protein [Anaeromicrobium sp.]MCT4593729.1 D-alanine--D-alanine ligase [Anaeromicrobium sp.]
MSKIKLGVIFGGESGEHEVSLMSATSVINAIDKEKYEVISIGITKKGKWMIYDGPVDKIETGEWENIAIDRIKSDGEKYAFSIIPVGGNNTKKLKDLVDVIFPVLHGPFGEDGTIQGLFEMANIPYVGAGVLASCVGMDKIYTKKVLERDGLPVGPYMVVMRRELENMDNTVLSIEKGLDYPIFIKPANLGSSVGITKAHNKEELIAGLKEAAKYDRKLLLEKHIDGKEIECAVYGNHNPKASIVGHIVPSHEFYDYEAKYFDHGKSKMIIPAPIEEKYSEKIRELAIEAYKAIDASGISRVDCFLNEETGEIYINELNTMPGFTKYSMYPLLWENTGVKYSDLIDKLIDFAFNRYKEKNR